MRLGLVAFIVKWWDYMPRRARLWAFMNDDIPYESASKTQNKIKSRDAD